jgi:hypothetical protein
LRNARRAAREMCGLNCMAAKLDGWETAFIYHTVARHEPPGDAGLGREVGADHPIMVAGEPLSPFLVERRGRVTRSRALQAKRNRCCAAPAWYRFR